LFKFIENSLFILIDLVLLILLNLSSLATSNSYVYIGFILSGISVLIVFNSLARMGYLSYHKGSQLLTDTSEDWMLEIKKPNTERIV
jgi:hypothetical protein